MTDFYLTLIGLVLTALQAVGLTSAWIARKTEGSACERLSQRVFYGCLAAVGMATIVAVGLGPCYWLASGGTLSAMVLTVTYDPDPSRRATAC